MYRTQLLTGDAPEPMQLFDLQNDPREQSNVALEHPEIVTRLKALYDEMNTAAGKAANQR